MKLAAGWGSTLAATAAAGRPVLLGLAALALVLVATLRWVLTSDDRTRRLVSVIGASRRGPTEPHGK